MRLILCVLAVTIMTALVEGANREHLVVLSHGIFGSAYDLSYLANKLEGNGFTVLRSNSNEAHRSLVGIERAADRLKDEILSTLQSKSFLSDISFVGNSLGGMITRFVIKLLYDSDSRTIAGLRPAKFMVSQV